MVTSKSEMVTNYWSFGKKYLVWKRTGWFFAFKKALKVVIDWGHLRSIKTIFIVVGTPWSHLGHKIQITLRIFFIELNHKGRRNFQKYNKINKKKALIFRLGPFKFGAGNETRTRDPNLGKVMLYQLSYSRNRSHYREFNQTVNSLCC